MQINIIVMEWRKFGVGLSVTLGLWNLWLTNLCKIHDSSLNERWFGV